MDHRMLRHVDAVITK